jgi:hypothetical protein
MSGSRHGTLSAISHGGGVCGKVAVQVSLMMLDGMQDIKAKGCRQREITFDRENKALLFIKHI